MMAKSKKEDNLYLLTSFQPAIGTLRPMKFRVGHYIK
jgi:hypothetical protein